jgi:3-hydroxy-9,10-secoandrosta-1,3,5(10)-triene-9,17-dione monooxygenase reductase component
MTAMVISESEYRTALGHFASGVVIVTGSTNGQPRGLACQSFFSLSLNPPLVAVALARTSASWADIQRSGVFGVNVLRADQAALCRTFGRSGADKFAEVAWVEGAAGSPRLRESLAWIECTIEQVHEAGDHLLAVGLVADVDVRPGHPLVFYRGGFGQLHECAIAAEDSNLDYLITGLRQGWG